MAKKAIIAMSGGVDSSVAAQICVSEGYECIGATMKLIDNDDVCDVREQTCCSLSDIEDARNVAFKLGMPYYVFNFTDDFGSKVIDKFVASYETGGTPNPCIDCNRYLKFDKLFRRMKELEYDYVVTGHYAQIEEKNGRFLLKKSVDLTKDQSYVLYSMTQEQLSHTLFPLGGMSKVQARKIAEENDFINANKKDSQDICFVLNGDYASFIESYTGKVYEGGNFVDRQGNVLGKHKGLIRYTVGQRRGLGLALPEPMYVCEKRLDTNEVVLCTAKELGVSELKATDFNWIAFEQPSEPFIAKAKVRYNMKEVPVKVIPDGEIVRFEFLETPQPVAKGQAVVVYDDDIVIGGGTII